jgi:BclB C-terminal domain-containing protein
MTYTVQIYSSTTPNDTFSPVPGAVVNINIPTSIAIGDTYNGITTGLNIAVTPQTRLLFIASATGGGLLATGTVAGFVSGGLGIS